MNDFLRFQHNFVSPTIEKSLLNFARNLLGNTPDVEEFDNPG